MSGGITGEEYAYGVYLSTYDKNSISTSGGTIDGTIKNNSMYVEANLWDAVGIFMLSGDIEGQAESNSMTVGGSGRNLYDMIDAEIAYDLAELNT